MLLVRLFRFQVKFTITFICIILNHLVISDFEMGIIRAFLNVFENYLDEISTSGCLFHLSQALFRKWRKLIRDQAYADDEEYGALVRKTFRLFLLILFYFENYKMGKHVFKIYH